MSAIQRLPLDIVCFHESGHAIVAWRLGLRLHKISAIATAEHAGGCWTSRDERPRTLLMIHAGPAAETQYTGLPPHDESDRRQLRQTAFLMVRDAATLDDPRVDELIERWRPTANALVIAYWSEIETVARALRNRRTLCWQDVCSLLDID
jgi:hypothetical protein